MSFLYPLGLLGLIGVPVLIIIYIIKNKYTEQVVSGTYLWTLSDRFLKRKNPINRITGIISLILQILAVICISFAVAQPVFVLRAAADDYCFILDGSGSMNMTRGGSTRFDIGKERIRSMIDETANGSTYTLIVAGETTDIVYEAVEDKKQATELLSDVTASYTASGFTDALNAAQAYFDEKPNLKTYVVTDKSFENISNAQVVNVAEGESNYAVTDVKYYFGASGDSSALVVEGTLFSYAGDATLQVNVYVDGSETPAASRDCAVRESVGYVFSLKCEGVNDFSSLRVAVGNSDSLATDNQVILYNVRHDEAFNTLIVSEHPFFVRTALSSIGNSQITSVTPDEFTKNSFSGYGLYVFDTFVPDVTPSDGAVWFVNPTQTAQKSGFSYQEYVELESSVKMTYSNSTSSAVKNLLKDTVKDDLYVKSYAKLGLYRSFTTLLSCEGSPLLFVGSNEYGNREVVFAFSFNQAHFTLSPDFVALTNNLVNYTFPAIVDETVYYCGDFVSVNVLAGCESIRVDAPSGKVEYLATDSSAASFGLFETGTYKITMAVGATERTVNVWSALPEAERYITVTESNFALSGEASGEKRDGKYDDLIYLFIILAVIFIADWMVYCYEQYQLR